MKLIEISEDILTSIKIPRMELEKALRIDLAIALYQREAISLGNARKLAGMSKWEFLEELGRRKVPRHYTEKEIGEDLAFAKSSL
jgi:predicted HTH domain antitoxin